MTMRGRRMRAVRRASIYVGVGLVVAALATELRKPAGSRTWQGQVAGVVPYNFRLPLSSPLPSSQTDRLVIPRSFGVGWSLNVPAVLRRLRTLRSSGRTTSR